MYVLQGTGIPCTRCVSHAGYLTLENSKDEEEDADARTVKEQYEIWEEGE